MCVFRDASDREWTITEKVPVVSDAPLDASSIYPQPGAVACELVGQRTDELGRTRCIIDTERPWGIAAETGETQFEVFFEQLKRRT